MGTILKGIVVTVRKSVIFTNAPMDARLMAIVMESFQSFHTGGFWDYPNEIKK